MKYQHILVLSLLFISTPVLISFAENRAHQSQANEGSLIDNFKPEELSNQKYSDVFPLMTLVEKIDASSYLKEKDAARFAYHPINLYDENNSTAWFEGVDGNGEGEYVEFSFFTPINISEISLHNGYSKSKKLFDNNGRVKQLEILINDEISQTIELEDVIDVQHFKLSYAGVISLRLTIIDVFSGVKYSDTGMSEINIDATIAHSKNESISWDKMNEIYNFYSTNVDYSGKYKKDFHQMTPEQLNWLLANNYSSLDGGGNDDRVLIMTKMIANNRLLVPVLLKSIYEKKQAYFFSESTDYDSYFDITSILWDNHPESIPLLIHSKNNNYSSIYHLLLLGDTRLISEYIDILTSEGIWHEFCCDLMPNQIITISKDGFVRKYLEDIINNQNNYPSEVYSELKKAYSQIE